MYKKMLTGIMLIISLMGIMVLMPAAQDSTMGETNIAEIYGRILTPSGESFLPAPEYGAGVELRNSRGDWIGGTGLAPDGSYDMNLDVPEGQYTLCVTAWGNSNPYADAVPVSITIGKEPGQKIAREVRLTAPLLTGKLLTPGGSVFTPAMDSDAAVYLWYPDITDGSGRVIRSGVRANGSFIIGGDVKPGSYLLWAECWGDSNPYASATCIPVQIEAGAVKVQDISLNEPLIKGRILQPDGSPYTLPDGYGIHIDLRGAQGGQQLAWTQVKSDGTYLLAPFIKDSISDGSYRLGTAVDTQGIPYCNPLEVPINISGGAVVTQNITLTNMVISGEIFKPDGTAYNPGDDSDVYIELKTAGGNGEKVGNANVCRDGSYKLGGNIPTGSYILYVSANGSNNPFAAPKPIQLQINAGEPVSCDVTLSEPRICGVLKTPEGTAFTRRGGRDARVIISSVDNFFNEIISAPVNSDGSYRLGGNLQAGDYYIHADTWGDGNTYTDSIPMIIHSGAEGTVVQDISLTNPVVAGRLLKPDGSPYAPGNIGRIGIGIRNSQGRDFSYSGVKSDGSFLLGPDRPGGIPAGDYRLFTKIESENIPYAASVELPIHVAEGTLSHQDIRLTDVAVQGRILKPDGSPFVLDGKNWVHINMYSGDTKGTPVGETDVFGDGSYRLGGGAAAGDYILTAATGGSGNPYTNSRYTRIHIEAGKALDQDITLTNPVIQGKVLRPDGSPLSLVNEDYARVALLTPGPMYNEVINADVSKDGSFRMGGEIQDGDYMLFAHNFGNDSKYENAVTVPVHIKNGELLTQDIRLSERLLSGKILKPDGQVFIPQRDSSMVDICLYSPDGANGGNRRWRCGIRDDGSFSAGGNIKDGDYLLRALAWGSENPYANSAAVPVHIESGKLAVKDLQLQSPVIEGKILCPDGTPFKPSREGAIFIELKKSQGLYLAWTEVRSDGSYKLGADSTEGFEPGDYEIDAVMEEYDSPYCSSLPAAVHIDEGQKVTQDIRLTEPVISGKILKPDGSLFKPGDNSSVNINLRNDIYSINVQVCSDGIYRIGGRIPEGDYFINVDTYGSQNPYTRAQSVNIHVTEGSKITQDITLTNPVLKGFVLAPSGDKLIIPDGDVWYNVMFTSLDGRYSTKANVYEDGSYRLGGDMPSGSYRVFVRAAGTENPYGNSPASDIQINVSEVKTMDFKVANPAIAGKMLTPDGKDFNALSDSGAMVYLIKPGSESKCIAYGVVNSDGSYRVGGAVPEGDYKLCTLATGDNNPYVESAPISVHYDGKTLLTRDLSLAKPLVTGYVLTPEGDPLGSTANTWSCAYMFKEYAMGTDGWMHMSDEENDLRNMTDNEWYGRIGFGRTNGSGVFKLGGVPGGEYKLLAQGYCGDENGDRPLSFHISYIDSSIIIKLPDLVIGNVTAPLTAAPGEKINLSWTVKNQGEGDAMNYYSWRERIYLSTDEKIDDSDIHLEKERRDTALAVGASYDISKSVTIPQVAPGSYYLLIKTDADSVLCEQKEWNNVVSRLITIGSTASSSEEHSSSKGLTMDMVSRKASMAGNITGDVAGAMSFTNIELVSATSGSFAGKGFINGEWTAEIGNITCSGILQGATYLVPSENKIYIKGVISGGEVGGIMQGFLTESSPGSGKYDKYTAEWKLNRVNGKDASVLLNVDGTLKLDTPVSYPGVQINALQTAMKSTVSGDYNEELDMILTHLEIIDQNNPYKGKGFSIISYNSAKGSGQGWTYDTVSSGSLCEIKGILTGPVEGIVNAVLNNQQGSRTLAMSVQSGRRGAPPMVDLRAEMKGPDTASPGQTLDYIIEYRNDGDKACDGLDVVMELPGELSFAGCTNGGIYSGGKVIWHINSLEPRGMGYVSVRVTVAWGLPQGHVIYTTVYAVENKTPIIGHDPNIKVDFVSANVGKNSVNISAKVNNTSESGNVSLEIAGVATDKQITPAMKITNNSDGSMEYAMAFTSTEGWEPYLGLKAASTAQNGMNLYNVKIKGDKEGAELIKKIIQSKDYIQEYNEREKFYKWLLEKGLINQETYDDYKNLFGARPYIDWVKDFLLKPKVPGVSEIVGEMLSGAADQLYQGLDSLLMGSIKARIIEAQYITHTLPVTWKDANGVEHEIRDLSTLKEYYYSVGIHRSVFKITIRAAHDPNAMYGPEGDVRPGQKLQYRAEYENTGEGIAFGVYVTNVLSTAFDDKTLKIGPMLSTKDGSQIAPPGIYNPATRTITWFVGEVGPKEGGYADYSVNVKADAPEGTEIINYATVYFPSVPEETRTNAIVSVVRPEPIIIPPVIPPVTPPVTPPSTGQTTNPETPTAPQKQPIKFRDVPDSFWAKIYIDEMSAKGVFTGKGSADTFKPEDYMTKAECAKVITTLLGIVDENAQASFRDVKKSDWSYKYVASAYQAGIIQGKPDGSFGASDLVTRQDLMVMLSRAIVKYYQAKPVKAILEGTEGEGTYKLTFADRDKIAPYALDAVATITKYGLLTGKSGNLMDPTGKTSRAEMAAMLYRIEKTFVKDK